MNERGSEANVTNKRRRRSLSSHLIYGEWDTALQIIRDRGFDLEELRRRDINGEVLLHLACKSGPPVELIQQLISLNPISVRELNVDGELPLHTACWNGARVDVIRTLMDRYAQSIPIQRHCDGKTPLDLAQEHRWLVHEDEQSAVIDILRRETFPKSFDEDERTGLPQKPAFKRWAPMPPPGCSDANLILVYIDISGFKAVNDNDSDEAGDKAIKRYAGNIRSACQQALRRGKEVKLDVNIDVFRLGGDEFAVVGKFSDEINDVWNKLFQELVATLADLNEQDEDADPPRYYTFVRLGCVGGKVSRAEYLLEQAETLQKKLKKDIDPNRSGRISLRNIRDEGITNVSDLVIFDEEERKHKHRCHPSSTEVSGTGMSSHLKLDNEATQEIDGYFIFQALPVVIGPRHSLHEMTHLQCIKTIEEHMNEKLNGKSSNLYDFMRKEFKIVLSDCWEKALCDMEQSQIHLLVWCAEGVDLLTESDCMQLFQGGLQYITLPRLAVVIMKYGAQRAAKTLKKIGVPNVIWMGMDPYEVHPLDLFDPTLVSICDRVMPRQNRFKEAFEILKSKAQCFGSATSSWGRDFEEQKTPPRKLIPSDGRLVLLPSRLRSMCDTNLLELSISGHFDEVEIQAGDLPMLTRTRAEIVSKARSDRNVSTLYVCPPTKVAGEKDLESCLLMRSRAFALELCKSFLRNEGITFHRGVFYLSCAQKNDIVAMKKKIPCSSGRLLLWVDLVDADTAANVDRYLKDWLHMLGKNVVLILTCHRIDFQRVERIVGGSYHYQALYVSGEDLAASRLHDNIRFVLSCQNHLVLDHILHRIDQLEAACSKTVLTLSDKSSDGQSFSVAAIYACNENNDQQQSLSIVLRICCSNIKYLTRLRDRFLICHEIGRAAEMLATELSHIDGALGVHGAIQVTFDRTAFADMFERCILRLHELTDHQRQKLDDCRRSMQILCPRTPRQENACYSGVTDFIRWIAGLGWGAIQKTSRTSSRVRIRKSPRVHIQGPAGAGKTFIALNLVQDFLQHYLDQCVLYVCTSTSLGLYFVKWLGRRIYNSRCAKNFMERVFLLSSSENKIMRIEYDELSGRLVCEACIDHPIFGIIVVDEAHHIFNVGNDGMALVKSRLTAMIEGRGALLLSDFSQSTSIEGSLLEFPPNMIEICLSEVARSTRRIVAGAMSYQLGDVTLIKCLHDCQGPPLRTLIFDLPDEQRDTRFNVYADKICSAISNLVSEKCFPGLDLHARVAILVPDLDFLENLKDSLKHKLALFAHTHDENLCLVSAIEASSMIYLGGHDIPRRRSASVVLDSVFEFCGQESLVVFGVGLDSPIDSAEDASLVRSRIYHAITRAQMAFYLINERIRDGWFEWLDLLDTAEETKEFAFDEFVGSLVKDTAANVIKNCNTRDTSVGYGESIPGNAQHDKEGRVDMSGIDDSMILWENHEPVQNYCVWDISQNDATSVKSLTKFAFVPRNDPEWQQKLRHKQQRLLLLRHASLCPSEEGKCPVTPHCASMKKLCKHIAVCKEQKCSVKHCVNCRYVLSHYRKCKDPQCPVCEPVREAIRRTRQKCQEAAEMAMQKEQRKKPLEQQRKQRIEQQQKQQGGPGNTEFSGIVW